MDAGARGPGVAAGGDGVVDHARAQEVAGALGKHRALDRAGFVAHPAGEVAQAQAQARAVAVGVEGAVQYGLEFAYPGVLLAGEPEIFPRGMSGADGARDVHGQALVHQQLA